MRMDNYEEFLRLPGPLNQNLPVSHRSLALSTPSVPYLPSTSPGSTWTRHERTTRYSFSCSSAYINRENLCSAGIRTCTSGSDAPIQFRYNHIRNNDNARPLRPLDVRNKLLNHHEVIQQDVRVDYDRDSSYRVWLGRWRWGCVTELTDVILRSVTTPMRALLPLKMGIVGLRTSVAVVAHVVSAVSRNAMMLFTKKIQK